MLKWKCRFLVGLFLVGGVLWADARAGRNSPTEKGGTKYALRYRFHYQGLHHLCYGDSGGRGEARLGRPGAL